MALDKIIEEKEKRGLSNQFDMFEIKAAEAQRIAREKAINDNLFTKEIILRLLQMYSKPHYYPNKNQLGSFKKLSKMGVSSYDIKKIKTGPVERIYLTEKGVKTILNYFYERKCIENYKKKDVLKDLETAAGKI
ncbi:hypothetical protein AYK26_02880 [Euryarchaeota archaeon SM23-78]|nr:MAG: hypothetical protein AYK26_02880 [Euryarchaeota archaeon SM23-78]MBW3001361.1 hypothetical protein [Candidatus Woesearchaeota archaeon]